VTCNRLQLAQQLRYHREQVADQPDIRNLEYRRILVLVDGDDDFAVLHACQMLDRAGDADRDVDFGGDDLAGLADLIVVGDIACVDCCTTCADACAELVGQRKYCCREGVGVLQRAAAGNDDLRAGQLRAFLLGDFASDEAGDASIAATRDGLDACRTAAGFCLRKGGAANVMTFFASEDCTVAIALPA
jgi:hypothetical protein